MIMAISKKLIEQPIWGYITIFLVNVVLKVLIGKFWLSENDIVLTSIISLSTIAFLFCAIFSKRITSKVILFSASAYFLFHLIIFPYTYLYFAKNVPNAIKFDKEILEIEKNKEHKKLNKLFSVSYGEALSELEKLSKNIDTNLDSEVVDVRRGSDDIKILKVDSYRIMQTVVMGKRPFRAISIEKNDQYPFVSIVDVVLRGTDYPYTFRGFIKGQIDISNSKSVEIRNREMELNSNKLWTYSSILPYLLYDSALVEFKHPTVIVWHALHINLCNIIFLTLISSGLYELISTLQKKRKT